MQDTLINLEIFAFIGILVWLYVRPSHLEKEADRQAARKATGTGTDT